MSLTSYITYIFAADTSSTTGAGKTGLAYSDFTAKQLIPGGTLASLTTENITTLGTFASPTSAAHIRIKEVSSSDPLKGVYEVQVHDTNMAWANRELFLMLSASGASIKPLRIDLQTLTITQDDSGSVLLAVSQPSVNFAELHVTGPMTADSFAIANNLQIDGTFSAVGFTINGIAPGAPSGLAIVGSAMTLTSSYDPAKTASQAGDAMTLTAAYDAAKTAATQTSVNALPSASTIATAVWAAGTRTLSSFGTLVADIWASASRTLTDIPAALLALFFTRDTTKVYADAVDGSVVKEIVANAGGGTAPTAGQIADAVWDEATSGHATPGSTGAALTSAGSAGDPWSSALPAAYTAGTAGYIIGNTIPAIKTKTDLLGAANIEIVAPLANDGTLTIIQGDDYKTADSRNISFSFSSVPNLTAATVTLSIINASTNATLASSVGTVTNPSTDPSVAFELTTSQTSAVPVTPRGQPAVRYAVAAVLSNADVVTLATGRVDVRAGTP